MHVVSDFLKAGTLSKALFILVSLLSLALCLNSKADTVTNVICYDDYTFFRMNYANGYTWNTEGMSSAGHLYGNIGDVGTLYGTIYTDDPEDPTFMLRTTLENETTFGWSAFHVNVWMTNTFTISAPTVHYPATSELGWSGVITSQPVFNGSVWIGQLDYYGPTIDIGETLDFSYKITFTGSTDYPFTQQMIPIPEPTSFSILALGGILLGAFKWSRRQAVARE